MLVLLTLNTRSPCNRLEISKFDLKLQEPEIIRFLNSRELRMFEIAIPSNNQNQ